MEDIEYERDYAEARDTRITSTYPAESLDLFDQLAESGILSAYGKRLDAFPKVIVAEDKQKYEYLLSRLDELAEYHGGKIKGIVSYQKWESHIFLEVPYLEFGNDREHQLLKEVNEMADLVTITATEGGWICVSIMINYFEDVVSDEEKSAILLEEFLKHPGLLSKLEDYRRQCDEALFAQAKNSEAVADFLSHMEAQSGISQEKIFEELISGLEDDPVGFGTELHRRIQEMGYKYDPPRGENGSDNT